MKPNVKVLTVFILSSFIISSLLLAVSSSFDIYAQTTNIQLSLPTACIFDDEDLPKQDPDDCDPIGNNGDTDGRDNILFTLDSSPELFDTFFCTLKNQNGNLVSSGDCFQSKTIAEDEYRDLVDGVYTFTVTASRTITNGNNDNSDDITESGVSPEFVFTVGAGSNGGGTDFGVDVVSPTSSNFSPSKLKQLLLNEKLGFLNLENKLKTNEVINTTSLACTFGTIGDSLTIYNSEFNCDRLLIFASQPPTSSSDSNTSKHNSPYLEDMYIYKVNNALSNGISGSLISCGISRDAGRDDDNVNIIEIKPIPCNEIFVAYELPS